MTDPFNATYIPNIELVLEQKVSEHWRRLSVEELSEKPLRPFCAGWHIEIPPTSSRLEGVEYLIIVVDAKFPYSQPRVFAPQAGSVFKWPHIEANGLLCLKSTRASTDPGARLYQHILWAQELLSYNDIAVKREFEREFLSYWGQRENTKHTNRKILSLITPSMGSREIVYYTNPQNDQIILADNRSELALWLGNRGTKVMDRDILPTWVFRLKRPWVPSEFPTFGNDALKYLQEEIGPDILVPDRPCPLIFEAKTVTGDVFVAVMLHSATKKVLVKGFRDISKVPDYLIRASFGSNRVERCGVIRVDGSWVHGRGLDKAYSVTHTRSIALVGCGSLGSPLVRLLAQTGIGSFTLVDHDELSSANVSRHALGMQAIGKKKAQAMKGTILQDFPHIKVVTAYTKRFEDLSLDELESISKVDLIISAGIDFDGDAILDAWRIGLSSPPAHLSTWTEAHAIVGHAVLLLRHESLMKAFDETEQVLFRLTDWPESSGSLVAEAGCGNMFQPFAAIDLQATVYLASRLAIDFLLGQVPQSCRRVWQGDLAAVATKGGIPRKDFSTSHVVKELPWF